MHSNQSPSSQQEELSTQSLKAKMFPLNAPTTFKNPLKLSERSLEKFRPLQRRSATLRRLTSAGKNYSSEMSQESIIEERKEVARSMTQAKLEAWTKQKVKAHLRAHDELMQFQ